MLRSHEQSSIQNEINKIIELTSPFPMTERLAARIYRAYGASSVERLQRNPYVLARDIHGIGQQTATKIANIIEAKLGKTFSPQIPMRAIVPKYQYRGAGRGKLSAEQLRCLKLQLRNAPSQVMPPYIPLNNPDHWTVHDLKQAVNYLYRVRWANTSSYYDLFKKCNMRYSREVKAFVPK